MIEDLKNQSRIWSTDVSRIGQGFKSNKPKNFSYPKGKFEKEEMSFLPAQCKKWTWLHYDEAKDHVLCIICKNATDHGMLNNVKAEDSFVKTGYSNWKNARSADKVFQKHESSKMSSDSYSGTSGNSKNNTRRFHNAEK